MNRKPKVQRRRVKALTDPQPEFVSLVTAGANMTPFKALKADEPTTPVVAEPSLPVVEEPVGEPAAKADTHDIVKFVFQKAVFADQDAVKAWLTDGGYEDASEITEDGETFVVGEADERAAKVEYTGVTVFVVAREVEAQAAADSAGPDAESSPTAVTDVQPVAKSDETSVEVVAAVVEERKRYDDFMAMFSDGTSLEKVLAAGYDGLPPAIHEVTNAMYVAVRNSALARDMGSIKSASAAYGDMVVKLCELFPAGGETDAAKAALAAEAPALDVTEPVAKADDVVVDATPVDATPAEITPVEATPVEVVAKTDDAPAAPVSPVSDLALLLTQLAASVQQLTTNVGDLHNQVAAKSEELAERVTAIESERQSRKGADVDEASSHTREPTRKSTPLGDLTFRAALGIQRKAP